ncbi:protein-glucosylgalactosylhydroxylysine glucosidase-like [Saccostrea echinata]|uniref:protein-glucosylgalactosylhydroxylysine glucosidase-like n=1 Tax=Saccostrea echinata TaxID=191078 RepID=UPI002A836D80|nr:protein-glucosylgalactosylhydroxylysine glucosidase-like [Saccostrea echinata]
MTLFPILGIVFLLCFSDRLAICANCPYSGNPTTSLNEITLIHGAKTRNIPFPDGRLLAPAPDITVLSNDTLTNDTRILPTIGNGHIATVVKSDTMCMNGLYNGYAIKTHRALLPSIMIKSITINGSAKSNYSIDFKNGMFVESHSGQNFSVTMKMYAHRSLPQLIVTELLMLNEQHLPLQLSISSGKATVTDDLDQNLSGSRSSPSDNNTGIFFGRIKEFEYSWNETRNVTMVYSRIPSNICVAPYQKMARLFLLSVDSNPQVAKEQFTEGVTLFINNTLENQHIQTWQSIWNNGRIDVVGNDNLAKLICSSLYYILSSLPLSEKPGFIGLSPGGLAHGLMYNGHVFWDQETWMYPPIQLLHSDIGKAIIKTRIRTLDNAKHQAMMRGFRGAMYPWESAFSGYDVTPVPPYFQFEKHITGDISFAARQYIYLTRDTHFLIHERGNEMIRDIAEFWESRAVFNKRTSVYEIYNVMPPDEYHHQINNSAYTNLVAQLSLRLPEFIDGLLGQYSKPLYKEVADNMYIPFDKSRRYHPEFDGYQQGEKVKQADVILMGFPLMMAMPGDVRRNDLLIYENVTPAGPAMTWGMFAIGYLELNDTTEAARLFRKQEENVAAPFNVWTENADGTGAVNFITGMGGFLQSLLFGYGGIRLHPDRIDFHGRLPPSTTSFKITGLDYLGGSIDLSFTNDKTNVTLTKMAKHPMKLKCEGKTVRLEVGKNIEFTTSPASLEPDFPLLPTKKPASTIPSNKFL